MDAIGWYCGIREVSEDKTSRSLLVAEALRAYVLWVDYAWIIFLVSLYSNLFISRSFRLRVAERFLHRVLWFSYSITGLGVILCLHLSFLTLGALHLLLIVYVYTLKSSSGLLHFIYPYFALS